MQCEICGGALAKDAKKCPRCGASVVNLAVAEPAKASASALEAPAPRVARPDQVSVPKPAAPSASAGAEQPVRTSQRAAAKRRSWLIAAGIVVVVAALIAAGVFVVRALNAAASPDVAAVRMLNALGTYDPQGVLDNATHASLTETDVATFIRQMQDSKKANNGLPTVKDVVVRSFSPDPVGDATTATVHLSANWLTDVATRKYAERDEILTVVKLNGRWLVRLFP